MTVWPQSFPPPAEAPLFPHQEHREGPLHVHPGRRGGDEIRTGGGEPGGGAHEWHLVLSGRLHQEQGNARLKGSNIFRVVRRRQRGAVPIVPSACVLCSCPKRWAFRWWATSSREPRPCCGQRPGSLSRPGRPRWEASSPAWRSLAWSWTSKVWYSNKCTGWEWGGGTADKTF